MQISTLTKHITTPAFHHSSFLQTGCPSCRPTNSVKALKAGVKSLVVSCHFSHYTHNIVVEFGEAIKNPAYRIPQTEYSGCLDISAHA